MMKLSKNSAPSFICWYNGVSSYVGYSSKIWKNNMLQDDVLRISGHSLFAIKKVNKNNHNIKAKIEIKMHENDYQTKPSFDMSES